ncbi:hypothetical protein CUMW_257790 [Citrus unshiu]|uniref:Uncharacterized protein n=1 Tax=Citrus unshiu TaxID=55188 RepID=A0A2H5QSK3_CITUN|nr:hypothetical protein CUMW_257790 [Citrus unshiu]
MGTSSVAIISSSNWRVLDTLRLEFNTRRMTWGLEDKSGLVIKREKVKEAIEKLMDRGKQGDEWIKRTRQLGEIANRAIGVGVSSHRNMEMLIRNPRPSPTPNQRAAIHLINS